MVYNTIMTMIMHYTTEVVTVEKGEVATKKSTTQYEVAKILCYSVNRFSVIMLQRLVNITTLSSSL